MLAYGTESIIRGYNGRGSSHTCSAGGPADSAFSRLIIRAIAFAAFSLSWSIIAVGGGRGSFLGPELWLLKKGKQENDHILVRFIETGEMHHHEISKT